MSQRLEFVLLAHQRALALSELCRRYRISRKTGYKWLKRYEAGGHAALVDRSRKPHRSPRQVSAAVAAMVLALREQTTWGGRKLHQRLKHLRSEAVPAASTCTQILRRAGQLRTDRPGGPLRRFERPGPNELWQMDHKGDFPTQSGPRCHPLTVCDDHSRYNLVLDAGSNRRTATVQAALHAAFARYGLPEAILCDNGGAWGNLAEGAGHTPLTVWLLRLGVRVLHGRPYHPQTQGKEERFHRTLQQELLDRHTWRDLAHCATEFSRFRQRYNHERPHDALQGATPDSRYRPSVRALPAALPVPEYSAMDVRTVRARGVITFGNQTWYIGEAFASLPIGLRPSPQADGQWEAYFGTFKLGILDFTAPALAKHLARKLTARLTLQD
ncbi:MAG TPA: IS481 family transposase [Candidatus Didemnitutus sp.]|nr:IS481 family transposase [Candidatus Didemnitutus sp.]